MFFSFPHLLFAKNYISIPSKSQAVRQMYVCYNFLKCSLVT